MAKHYLTRAGARELSDELERLLGRDRARVVQEVAEAAAQGDRSENAEYIYGKKRLREIDRRIRFLTKRLDDAVVVGDDEQRIPGVVYFGAKVTVEDEDGVQKQYHVVGVDEARPEAGKISYQSPLGRVLMKRRVGDVVEFKRPAGEVELEILAIDY